ncbi:TARBP1, partial [Symbiodinium microadriaticum]
QSPRLPLVVVASMVDKLPNMAGLCRTCEVFYCEALCLPNLKVATEQAFQSISVTAEKWLPMRGVPKGELRAQLGELRQQGYALVGVEQTHTSVPLDQWKFAERTAIVLGAEKEGIDAALLPLLDGCVEIPQQGQLRSLN